jgi:hypothetical protein
VTERADDLVTALAPVVAAFTRLRIPHYVGGSVASTFHGAIRSTMDIDLVCSLQMSQVEAFIAACGEGYYVSRSAVQQAVEKRSCFNLIHLSSAYKVDVFVSRGRRFDKAAMDRAVARPLASVPPLTVSMATVEDSIVSKLEWFRLGDEVSERQRSDVTRLVTLHRDSLDTEYLRTMAESVGVADLLAQLLGGQD